MFATGVTIVTARTPDGKLVGLTANSFNSVSLTPPLVLWSLSHSARSMTAFRSVSHYAINILGASVSEQHCNGLQIYGIVGSVFGGLMAASGGVILGLGLVQRRRHRQWKREAGLVLAPLLGPGQRGLSLGFRF